MSKKSNFTTTKEQHILKTQQELQNGERQPPAKMVQTTLVIESTLLYAVKEIALKRKQAGIKPDTVTGIIKDALRDIVRKEKESSPRNV